MEAVTGAITLFGAAVKVARGVQQLQDVRKLPSEFSSLLAELADLEHALTECHNSLQTNSCLRDRSDLLQLGKTAMLKLEELAKSLAANTRPNGFRSTKEIQAFWTGLVHGKNRISRCRDELRDIRLGLAASLQVVVS